MTAPTTLTADERALLTMLADGLTARQISRRIDRSEVTTRQRMWRMYSRLGAVNAPHAVAIAMRSGALR